MELTEYEASHKRQWHFRNIEQLFLHCSLERDYSRTGNVFLLKRRRKSLPFSWLVFNSLGLIFGTAFKEYWSPAMTLFTCERYWTDKRQSGAGRQQTCADKRGGWRDHRGAVKERVWGRGVEQMCGLCGGRSTTAVHLDGCEVPMTGEWKENGKDSNLVTLKPVHSRASDAFTVLLKTMLNLFAKSTRWKVL